MDRTVTTPHRLVNPAQLAPPAGYTHAVVSSAGRTVHVAGQIGADADGRVATTDLAAQLDVALGNLIVALDAAGAAPEHVVTMQLFTTVMDEYRNNLREIGRVYRRHLGRHFPAMALVGVTELVEPAAKIEVMATAVIVDDSPAWPPSGSGQ
jgi:enamine deaminase RidA (YjgF/YER057c/UK114 family)